MIEHYLTSTAISPATGTPSTNLFCLNSLLTPDITIPSGNQSAPPAPNLRGRRCVPSTLSCYCLVTMAHQVHVDGLVLDVPDRDHCWDFRVVYSCGCPAKKTQGLAQDLVIRVKKDNHSGPCFLRRCVIASETHVLQGQCVRCDVYDRRLDGVYV